MKIHVEFTAEENPDLKSAAIMKFMKTPFSHVLIRYADQFGEEKLFHATSPCVCVQKTLDYMPGHKVAASFEITLDCSPDRFFGFVEGSCGKEYSQSQLLAIVSRTRLADNGSEKMICSELVADVLKRFSSVPISGVIDRITPGDLYQILRRKEVV